MRKRRPIPLIPPKLAINVPGDDGARHLDITIDDDFLHIVTKVRHRPQRVSPDRFFLLDTRRGEPSRGVDDNVRVE